MNLAQYLRTALSNWIAGNPFPSAPNSVSLALSTADPTYDGSGIAEPVGGGYSRQTFAYGTVVESGGGAVTAASNNAPIVFNATASWGNVTHGAIFDDSNNLLFFGALNAPKNVTTGDSVSFASGSVEATVGGLWSSYVGTWLLSWVKGTAAPSAPSTFVALSRTNPTRTNAGLDEPTGGYARQVTTFSTTSNASLGTIISNQNAAVFGPATAPWGDVTHAALLDAAVGGNQLMAGPVAVQRNISAGDAYAISPNALTQTIR